MRSVQLKGHRGAVHTIGVTAQGILYVDVQHFGEERGNQASTYYVRVADVRRIKRRAAPWRRDMTDLELVNLLAASFHTAEYALEWLYWARIPTVRRFDGEARLNAEDQIPQEALL